MKANVQYNDYRGTTAADRSDYLETNLVKISEIIISSFNIPLSAEEFQFIGISVYGTQISNVSVSFYFRNKDNKEVVRYLKPSMELQAVLDLFKRFEFQVGSHLEEIDRENVIDIE